MRDQGMKEVVIKDICKKGSSALKQKELLSVGKYPVYGASGIAGYLDSYHQEDAYIGIVKDGSGIGRVTFYPEKTSLIGTMQYILPKKGFNIRYIGYCLQSLDLSKYKQGAAIPHIYFRDYGERIVKVTDNESEQQSIVDYLDSAFAKIDAMKANAEKALNEAKALFQASLKEMLKPKEGWEEKSLGAMSYIQSGFPFKSSQFVKKGQYQVIRMGNVRNGLIRYNEAPVFVNQIDNSVKEKAMLQLGDLIITQTGSRNKRDYGYTVLIEKEGLLLNQRIARIRVKDTITNKYLLYYSWTDYFRDQYFANEGGTVGQGNVGIDAIKDAIISYPPETEQQSIVDTLDSLKSKVDRLQENYDKISQECDALKQAILRQVFE